MFATTLDADGISQPNETGGSIDLRFAGSAERPCALSDNQLLERIRRGDQAHLGQIYEKYRDEFLRWVEKECNLSMDDCKDIYQSTIVIFHDNVRSGKLVRLSSSLKTYLFAIGKNLAHEYMRGYQRRSAFDKAKVWQEVYWQSDVMDASVVEAAQRAISRLSERDRKLIELFYYERKSMEQISDILNYRNGDTAKNLKCKCMARLRKFFKEELIKRQASIWS